MRNTLDLLHPRMALRVQSATSVFISRNRLCSCVVAVPALTHRTQRRGFTLIEILVVIVILGVLATLVAPNVLSNVGTAKDARAPSQIEMLGAALDAYRLDNGRYPTT